MNTRHISLRVPKEVREALDLVARDEQRTRSGQVLFILGQYLRSRGAMPAAGHAKRKEAATA